MNAIQSIDISVLLFIQEHLRVPFLTPFFRAVTFLGELGWFWIATIIVLLCLKKTRPAAFTAFLALAAGFVITNLLLKNAVARIRPYDLYSEIMPMVAKPSDYSFPSGHTCASFAVALVYFRLLPGRIGVTSLVLAALIALSRLYLGVHYPTDVLGGLLVAVATSFAACWFMKKKMGSRLYYGSVQ